MLEVKDDDGFIECPLRANPVAISPTNPVRDDVLGIWEHEEFVLGSCWRASLHCPIKPQGRRTIGKVLRFRFLQTQVVDPSMCRVVLRIPVELFEKVGAHNGEFALIARGCAARDMRERKSEG
jgi:hypothetical protein